MKSIAVDSENSLVHVTLEGFWSQEVANAFIEEERRALSQLRCKPGDHVLLCDLSSMEILSQDVLAMLSEQLNSDQPKDARRIAIVVRSALQRLQLKRVTRRQNIERFDDVHSARDWLLSPDI